MEKVMIFEDYSIPWLQVKEWQANKRITGKD